ncbi:MAG: hypothetical protein JWN95_209 [Frankiales bacterium]|nr:hypothetical protein [Frankiales bacterium]
MSDVPTPIKIILGLAATATEEARKLPATLPTAATTVPLLAISTAMQASLRVQQRLATLASRGDEVIRQLRGESDAPPAWATFDDPPAHGPTSTSRPARAPFDDAALDDVAYDDAPFSDTPFEDVTLDDQAVLVDLDDLSDEATDLLTDVGYITAASDLPPAEPRTRPTKRAAAKKPAKKASPAKATPLTAAPLKPVLGEHTVPGEQTVPGERTAPAKRPAAKSAAVKRAAGKATPLPPVE